MPKSLLTGVLTELVAPFCADGSLDYNSLQRLIDFQIDCGIRGIYVHGISAETLSMTNSEQTRFVSDAVKAANGRIPVVANLMCSNKERALEQLDAFEDCGVDCICASQPLMLSAGDEALYDYFAAIFEQSHLPVCLYNMPQSGYVLSPKLISRLAKQYPIFQGYKDSTQNIIHLQTVAGEVNRDNFSILAGSDATFYSTLALGGSGIVSLISLIFPDLVNGLYQAFCDRNYKEAFSRQIFIMKVRDALKSAPLIAGYKTVVKHLGLFETDFVRSPLLATQQEQANALLKKLENLGVL